MSLRWLARPVSIGALMLALVALSAGLLPQHSRAYPPATWGYLRAYPVSSANGQYVQLPTVISLDGVAQNAYATNWTAIETGNYTVCFSEVEDWTPSGNGCTSVTIQSQQTATVAWPFTSTPGVGGNPGDGLIRVTTVPPINARLTIDGLERDSWGIDWMGIPSGQHTVGATDPVWGGFMEPEAPQSVYVPCSGSGECDPNATYVTVRFAPKASWTYYVASYNPTYWYDRGCDAADRAEAPLPWALRPQDSFVGLLFGQQRDNAEGQWSVYGQWGILGDIPDRYATHAEVHAIALAFAQGYDLCRDAATHLTLAVATNNSYDTADGEYPPASAIVRYEGGVAWGQLINGLRADPSLPDDITIEGGNNIEGGDPSWNAGPTATIQWIGGYTLTVGPLRRLYNFGAMIACPATGGGNYPPTTQGGGEDCIWQDPRDPPPPIPVHVWNMENYYYVTKFGITRTIPEVFWPGQASSWQRLSYYVNEVFTGQPLPYHAVMTQDRQCDEFQETADPADNCTSGWIWSPFLGYHTPLSHLFNDPKTGWYPTYSTDLGLGHE